MEELKPCPFCGFKVEHICTTREREKATGVSLNGPDEFVIRCGCCRYDLAYDFRSQHKQVVAWNNRMTNEFSNSNKVGE